MSVWIHFDESSLREDGVRAVGVVLEVREGYRSNSDMAEVEFTTIDGERVAHDVDVPEIELPEEGDRLEVAYRRDDPSEVVVGDVDGSKYWLTRILWVPILVLLPGLLVVPLGGWQPRRLRRSS